MGNMLERGRARVDMQTYADADVLNARHQSLNYFQFAYSYFSCLRSNKSHNRRAIQMGCRNSCACARASNASDRPDDWMDAAGVVGEVGGGERTFALDARDAALHFCSRFFHERTICNISIYLASLLAISIGYVIYPHCTRAHAHAHTYIRKQTHTQTHTYERGWEG